MQEIRNIIFDFGGVFIGVDYKKTENAFVTAGIANFHDLYSQHDASPLFEQLEKGEVDPSHFYNELKRLSGVSLSDEQIVRCWNSMLGPFYPEAIEKARSLQGKYRLFLFSNTNAIHYDHVMDTYEAQFGKRDFDQLFERAYYSHISGIRKPYPEAYEWVLKDAGLEAAESVFIDDTISNIEGAREVGLHTIFLQPPMKMWELDFEALGHNG